MNSSASLAAIAALLGLSGTAALAQSTSQSSANIAPSSDTNREYNFSLFGGAEHQFPSIISTGGEFNLTRVGIGGAFHHEFTPDLSATFTLTYGVDLYDFRATAVAPTVLGVAPPANPWDDIHTLTAAAIFSYKLNNDWSIFGGPLLQSARESGADFGDSIIGGGAIGAVYHASDDLSIGGGVAIASQLEDSARIFPIIVINWQFADRFSLRNTSTSNATSRTGLELIFEPTNQWELALGAASQFSRFRLDNDPAAPGGVGEDSSVPIWFRLTFKPTDQFSVEAIIGMNFSGEFRLENSAGGFLASSDYDGASFCGLFGSFRF